MGGRWLGARWADESAPITWRMDRAQAGHGAMGDMGVHLEIAKLAREHNDANVLVLPARFVSEDDGVAILKAWLDTPFEGGRHQRRVDKIENDEH